MTYAETAELVANYGFQTRVLAASTEQALIFVNDARPEFKVPAERIIVSASAAIPLVSLVAGQPAIVEASTDGDILAALQAVWPKYGAALIGT